MNKNKKRLILFSLLFTVILAVVSIYCLYGLKNNGNDDISTNPSTLDESPDYGANYIDNIIFLGDYSIARMSEYAEQLGISENMIWTGKDGTLDLDFNIDKTTIILPNSNEETSLSVVLKDRKPQYLLITVGIENAVPYCDKETFCNYYEKLINTVKKNSPDTKIILQSILPVTSKYEFKNKEFSNDKIDTCNTWICELAEKNDVKFLNTAETLKASNGKLKKDYASKDGNSLNAEGYATLLTYIRTHGYK